MTAQPSRRSCCRMYPYVSTSVGGGFFGILPSVVRVPFAFVLTLRDGVTYVKLWQWAIMQKQTEPTRLQVLNNLLAEHMTLDQAATLMGVSTRHTRRLLAAYREKGVAAVAHGHRGRRAPNATPEAVLADVVHLAGTRYPRANHTHLSELLSEREGIDIGRTTLRRILVNAGLKSPRRRRPPKHRVRRQRMPREGMLIQMDGSFHPWLGDQVPPFTLLIAVDDATGTVADALFCE